MNAEQLQADTLEFLHLLRKRVSELRKEGPLNNYSKLELLSAVNRLYSLLVMSEPDDKTRLCITLETVNVASYCCRLFTERS